MDAASAALLGAVLEALPGHPVAGRHDPARRAGRVRQRRTRPAGRASGSSRWSPPRRSRSRSGSRRTRRCRPRVLALAAERSAGNPQFLRDLLASADADGEALTETIEAAATARIDRLAPHDRALVRRASVLGMSFHPRMLADVLDGAPAPDAAFWRRLDDVFADDGDGWLRFRIGVLRDAAYAGLPFRTRRRLHAVAGARLEHELGARRRRAGRRALAALLPRRRPRAGLALRAPGGRPCARAGRARRRGPAVPARGRRGARRRRRRRASSRTALGGARRVPTRAPAAPRTRRPRSGGRGGSWPAIPSARPRCCCARPSSPTAPATPRRPCAAACGRCACWRASRAAARRAAARACSPRSR